MMSGTHAGFLEPLERELAALQPRSLGFVFAFAAEASPRVLSLIDQIGEVTPHADDHPTLEGLSAQDACICTDSAVRGAGGLVIGPKAIWYAFEPLRGTICDELTGALDIGSGADAEETERRLSNDPRMVAELQLFLRVVGMLRQDPGAKFYRGQLVT